MYGVTDFYKLQLVFRPTIRSSRLRKQFIKRVKSKQSKLYKNAESTLDKKHPLNKNQLLELNKSFNIIRKPKI